MTTQRIPKSWWQILASLIGLRTWKMVPVQFAAYQATWLQRYVGTLFNKNSPASKKGNNWYCIGIIGGL
jgi:hypothetical protein